MFKSCHKRPWALWWAGPKLFDTISATKQTLMFVILLVVCFLLSFDSLVCLPLSTSFVERGIERRLIIEIARMKQVFTRYGFLVVWLTRLVYAEISYGCYGSIIAPPVFSKIWDKARVSIWCGRAQYIEQTKWYLYLLFIISSSETMCARINARWN